MPPEAMVRFDDCLTTVLTFDTDGDIGARSAWRQLVDLIGRGRVSADDAMMSRLRSLRKLVPERVRIASAHGLAALDPRADIVALFAEDLLPVAEPLLSTMSLSREDWQDVLPRLTTAQRALLREREDLPTDAVQGLAMLATLDLAPATTSPPPISAPDAPAAPDYPLAELVERIERFRKARSDAPRPVATEPATRFTFRADTGGVLVAIDGAAPGALVGLSIAHSGQQGAGQVDGGIAGAFRRRSRFADARLEVGGESMAAGSWRLSGVPAFDAATGRFTGYDGVGRRPRADESAASTRIERADSLRQLVHELRTPANAISGFAELIEAEMMGPVPPTQRARAAAIRACANDLIAAIDDLDTAARLDGRVLDMRPAAVPLVPLLDGVLTDLAALIDLRGAAVDVRRSDGLVDVLGDDRILERLLGRLLAVIVAAATPAERLTVSIEPVGEFVRVTLSRPRAWHGLDEASLFSMDAGGEGAPLLGTGFCLRLARNLAAELGGSLAVGIDDLVLRFPAMLSPTMGQISGG